MPELRKDPFSDTWIVISPERKLRPLYIKGTPGESYLEPGDCPFCEGNESMTPPEIYAQRVTSSKPNRPGWTLRVVPNKFPALRIEGLLEEKDEALYDKLSGIGAHEVIIETVSHHKGIDELSIDAITSIFKTYKRRIIDLKQDKRFRYIQIFKNCGSRAGATIPHPHSQLVAMPVVPGRLQERLNRAKAHFDNRGRCLFCDILQYECEYKRRILLKTTEYIVMAPYASRLPFELSVFPRSHCAIFEEIYDNSIQGLAEVFKATVRKVNTALGKPAYNLILHNAPFHRNYKEYFHWHMEILPVITGTGGFEVGTYTYINPTPPEEVVEVLNKI